MTKKILCILLASAMAAGAAPTVSAAPETALLDTSGFRIMDENLVYIGADYLNAATVLFDDQDKVPASFESPRVDAALWDATQRSKNWKPNWQSEFGEDAFLIDMGANYHISGICFLDTNGAQTWKIEAGTPFDWTEIGSFETDQYQVWRGLKLDAGETRYLRFSTPCGDSGVSELAIYGYKVSELSDAQKKKTAAKPSGSNKIQISAAQQIGFNAFIDDPMTAISAGGNVREYHNLSWLLDDAGKVKFTQGTWGDMDSFYGAMHARDISIIPCFQGGSAAISGEKPPEIPVAKGADTTDAKSYAVHGQAMYQVAARYGSNPDVDPKTLNVADGSEPKIALRLLQALENCNEPNKTWSGKANYFTPYELAAMCSADFDGHEGTIKNAGVHKADPDFQLAVGGLLMTASVLDYLSEMKMWFDYNRTDGRFAVDIINVHLGPDTFNPEDSGMVGRIRELQSWIAENAPGTALWISEFEIPMSDCETEGVDNHDNEAYQLKYAQRVARTYLTAIGAGVDRMTKFQLRDEGEGVYYNSGLVTQKGSWSKKPAWYYVSCMTNVLKDCVFAADMDEAEKTGDGVKRYFFINNKTGDSVYCLWLPTNTGAVKKNYAVTVPADANVYLTVPGTYAEGVTSALTPESSKVTVDVSETPVFLTVSASEKQIINGRGRYIRPALLSLTEDLSGETCDLSAAPKDTKLDQFYRMFDEPATMPEFIYGDTADLAAPETNVRSSGISCYVSLGQPYVLDGFGVFDTYGSGSIEIYDAHTDTLLWSSDLGSYMAKNLCPADPSAPTDLLYIVKGGGDLNELALYGYPAPEADENADAAALLRWLLTKDTKLNASAAADINGDGILDSRDLTLLKRKLKN